MDLREPSPHDPPARTTPPTPRDSAHAPGPSSRSITVEGDLDRRLPRARSPSSARASSSPEAEQFAFELAAVLARAGAVVVSGGALGIDAAAHRGALSVGGRTWAVTGSGRDHPFPKEHADLYREIASARGAVLSPFADDVPARQGNFPRRNGVLVALADAVVIVQAGAPSGSLNAASWAHASSGAACGPSPGRRGTRPSPGAARSSTPARASSRRSTAPPRRARPADRPEQLGLRLGPDLPPGSRPPRAAAPAAPPESTTPPGQALCSPLCTAQPQPHR